VLKRKPVIIGFLAFCLIATLFIGATTSGDITNPSATVAPEYDPWKDINDDGKINILDILGLAVIFGTEGTPIDKAAIAYNSTVVYSHLYTTNTSEIDMEDTNLTITLVRPSDLLIMFSAEAHTNQSDGQIYLSARVDGYYAEPSGIYFTPWVSPATTDGHSHTLGYMACAFNFLYYNASAGTHTVKIQWAVSYACRGSVYYRTLAVMAVNQ